MPDSVAIRRRLAKKGQMGCPKTLNYMLDTKKHVRAAVTRYNASGNIQCEGFWGRWCKNAKRVGYTKIPTYKKKCRR